jgi:hypothetical protein
MAVTKIHAIKGTLDKALAYIENPDKTDGQMLLSAYNVDPLFASTEFLMTQALAREINGDYRNTGGGDNLAYHLMQSFSPKDNLTPEKAHEIGRQLAAEFLEGRYEYVVTTHVDKGHIHNHIMINAVSFYDHKKLQTKPYKTAAQIRNISDRICAENTLSVLPEKANKGYSRTEYLARKANNSWKSELRKRLRYALEVSAGYDQFVEVAAALGVTVNNEGKHIKYKLVGQEKYSRGNKLSEENEFLNEGIYRRTKANENCFALVKSAIKETAPASASFEDFVKRLKELYSIDVKTYKSGDTIYTVEGHKVTDYALGNAFSKDNIEAAINTKTAIVEGITTSEQHMARFDENTARRPKREDTKVTAGSGAVAKVTAEGILLELPDGSGRTGRIFIGNRAVDYDASTHHYDVYIDGVKDYYFVSDDLNPDIPESAQLSSKFVKGEEIIRGLDKLAGTVPMEIEVFASDIKSMTPEGVTLSLPEQGIGSLFIEREYVEFDRLTNRCTIKLFENWNYAFTGAGKSRDRIKGSRLAEMLEQRNGDNQGLYRRLARLRDREASAKLKDLSHTLLIIRRENIVHAGDFNVRMNELRKQAAGVNNTISTLISKNQQYNQVAKYLLAIKDYKEIKSNSGLSGKAFSQRYEGEALAYDHAVKQLNKLGVDMTVDPQKVLSLVAEQSGRADSLLESVKDIEQRIERIQNAQTVVGAVLDGTETPVRDMGARKDARE